MKKLLLTAIILGVTAMSAEARTTFTKPYRCVAGEDKISRYNPLEPMIGTTYFNEVLNPYNHQDDTIEGMNQYIEENDISWTEPEL